MARNFVVKVNHKSSFVSEVVENLRRIDWIAVIDGITVNYAIEKDCVGSPHNWFERGTTELQYHAKNISQTGVVLWQKRPKRQHNATKKQKAVQEKMKKLL